MDTLTYRLAITALSLAVPLLLVLKSTSNRRHIPSERVLILGASSGLGRSLALHYAQRGARVCVVARRADKLGKTFDGDYRCLVQVADMTVVADMVRVRAAVAAAWGGLDTVHVCAGVSALQPVMVLAGVGHGDPQDATAEGVAAAVEVAGRAMKGNFEGPLVAAVTFVRHASSSLVSMSCKNV